MSDKDNSVPFWKSIRGVGKPGTHKPTWESVTLSSVPYKDYDNMEYTGPKEELIEVVAPKCPRCGLAAEKAWPNNWYCHFCLDDVKAPMRPGAMIPKSSVGDSSTLLPSITDPTGEMICPKCGTTRLPRVDNQGYDCKCGTIWNIPGVRRVSPTNGF